MIFPNSVFIPVAYTLALARPVVTNVPLNSFPSFPSPTVLFTGTLSPVSIDSSAFRENASRISQSAGIFSPSEISIRSSGTSSLIGISFSSPFLITMAVGTTIFLSAATAFSALYSCMNPIIELIMTMANIANPSIISPRKIEMLPAIMSMIIRNDENCERKIFRAVYSFLLGISLGPNLRKLA